MGNIFISSVSSLSFLFLSSLSLSLISSTISSITFLPFSGRRHKMTHKGWRVVKPQHNQSTCTSTQFGKVLVYSSLDSLESVEGTWDQRRHWLDCTDVFAGHTSLIVDFALHWLTNHYHVIIHVVSFLDSVFKGTVHDKTFNKTCGLWKLRLACISAQSDQSNRWFHVPSTTSGLSNENPCHPELIHRLICVFAGDTSYCSVLANI